MKKYLVVVLASFVSTMGFANEAVSTSTEPNPVLATCKFKTGKKGGACVTTSRLCLNQTPGTDGSFAAMHCKEGINLHVKCTDGFKVDDGAADLLVSVIAPKPHLMLVGKDGDNESYVRINFLDEVEENTYKARLLNVQDDVDSDHYRGHCKISAIAN